MNALSQPSEYAIRVLTYLAQQGGREYCLVRQMGETLDIPAAYLVKVLQPLVSRGMLESRRGRGGGYRLARPAARITLFELVDAIDHISSDVRCVLGQAKCSDERACPAHSYWKGACAEFRSFLANNSIDDVELFCRTKPECNYPA